MSSNQYLGIDIGTSRCRVVLYNVNGEILAESSRAYSILNPHPGWQEQDPEIVLNALLESLQALRDKFDRGQLMGVGLSGYFNSIIPVDSHGKPLMQCMLWTDTRSKKESLSLAHHCDVQDLYYRTGCPPHPLFPLAKLMWIRNNHPRIFSHAHKFVAMKDYVIWRLFGEWVTDWSTASSSGMFNIHALEWDPLALDLLGLSVDKLPVTDSPLTRLPPIRSEFAKMTGLDPSIPVILGAGDGALSNIGTGAIHPHEADNTVGTGGAVRTLVDRPTLDTQRRTWCYAFLPEHWAVGGLTAAGLIYEWFIREFVGKSSGKGKNVYQMLEEYAQSVAPGSSGLIFLPFLTGSRSPIWNPNARGVLFGLTYDHTFKHIVRAVMEGVSYNRLSVLESVESTAGKISSLRVSGGFVHSPTWLQITADVYGRDLLVPSSAEEATSLGAAFLSMLEVGELNQLDDARTKVAIRDVIKPRPESHALYKKMYALYQAVYKKLRPEFEAVTTTEVQNAGP